MNTKTNIMTIKVKNMSKAAKLGFENEIVPIAKKWQLIDMENKYISAVHKLDYEYTMGLELALHNGYLNHEITVGCETEMETNTTKNEHDKLTGFWVELYCHVPDMEETPCYTFNINLNGGVSNMNKKGVYGIYKAILEAELAAFTTNYNITTCRARKTPLQPTIKL